MAARYITFILILSVLITGCITPPNLTTGEGCWRYGVVEGEVTQTPSTDITYLSMDDIVIACGETAWDKTALGCYHPIGHKISLYWGAGKVGKFHEKCHSIMRLPEHNNCKGYGIGKDASACDWDQDQT